MENLNLILFICFAAPLLMALLVFKGSSRTTLLFLLLGMVVCLFCSEFNAVLLNLLRVNRRFFTVNYTPVIEETGKAIPVLLFAFLYHPKKQTLLECSLLTGVGFSILENAFILASSADQASIPFALIRGFSCGTMHGLCTMAVGFGISFVYTKRKLFYTGTTALLCAAVIFHSIYNNLVQSEHAVTGFLLPSAVLFLTLLLQRIKKV